MGKLIVNLVILYGHFDIDVNNSGIVSIGIHKHFLIHPSICSIRMFSFVLVGLFHIFGGIFFSFRTTLNLCCNTNYKYSGKHCNLCISFIMVTLLN